MSAKGGKVRKEEGLTDSDYHPTKEEMEEDVSIDASPEEVARALFSGDPPVVESGRGEQSRQEWEAWKARRANGG